MKDRHDDACLQDKNMIKAPWSVNLAEMMNCTFTERFGLKNKQM